MLDDLGTAAKTFEELFVNLEAIFECVQNTGLRLTPSKCEFGLKEMTFLRITIASEGMSPNKTKVTDFLATLKPPEAIKQIRRFIGFFQYFRSFNPKLAEKLLHLLPIVTKRIIHCSNRKTP